MRNHLFILTFFFLSFVVQAQIKVTYPIERSIFQRDNGNQAAIYVGGYYTQAIDKVEARLVPVLSGQGEATDWLTVQNNPQGGVYFGKITGRGGWYSLEVRGTLRGVRVGSDILNRVGIGEVFIISGQSNAEGIFNYGAQAPADDRVNTTTFNNRTTQLLEPPGLSFAPVTAEGIIGPRGRSAWCWGSLGDLLIKKLNVPIMFLNTGWESMPIRSWLESAQGGGNTVVTNFFTGDKLPVGMPYANLKAALKYYGSVLGVRSILWIHGEVDNNPLKTSKEDYQQALQLLINITRQDMGSNIYVPWLVARTSRVDIGPAQRIIDAQNAVINIDFFKIYPGPVTDNVQPNRPDGVHFKNEGLVELAQAWNNVLPPSFFATTVPILPRPAQPLVVSCNSTNASINIRPPAGFNSFKWTNGQTDGVITASAPGTYQAIMRDAERNAIFTPSLVISEAIQPPNPVITPSGEQIICTDSTLNLSVNVSPINTITWSNGQTGRSITASKPGVFTARLTNVFGCASGTAAAVTLKNITIKPPVITQVGRYSLEGIPDSIIFSSKDTKVTNILWDWRQNGRLLSGNSSTIKAIQKDVYSVRSRVTFEGISGGGTRVCPSGFSAAYSFDPPTNDEGLLVFSNPNRTGLVSIETLRDLSNVDITVSNLTGQVVFTQKLPTLTERRILDLRTLSEGEYLIRVTSSGLSQTRRVIIDY
jgi:Carbohydrate esterase, sialic acid-specific acetylesterase/Secretion system C-terminal sorting domain